MKMKLNNMKFISLSLLLLCFLNMNAQQTLTLEDALKIALENNYEIKIASNNSKINQTNVAVGNAGKSYCFGSRQ